MSWSLYEEVTKNNKRDYSVYRCVDPVAVKTGEPWFNNTNICPCNPKLSNVTGRGFTPCPFGISQPNFSELRAVDAPSSQIVGSLYSENQVVPPQLQPRELYRIGVEWRNAN
jgi:hypothetical protein